MRWLIYVLVIIIMYEVTLRYIFGLPTVWVFEASTMVFGALALGSGAYAQVNKAHVSMDLFYRGRSKRTKAVMDACTYPLFIGFLIVLMWKSGAYAYLSLARLEHSTTAWGPPLYLIKTAIPVATALLALQGFADFVRNVAFAITGGDL
ncbi:MAG: TRAP transporter small permease subunit [Deltaproteobacteria bacterium]|nr:TRAP transporter small permease subunit [Deltaproteobacteria bacterium]